MPGIILTASESATGTDLTGISTVVTKVWEWFTGFVGTATDNPVILVPIGFGIAGATVGLFRRATRVGGRRK